MADARWKAFEREVARALGGSRTGPTGRDSPDVSGVEISPECKYQKRLSLRAADVTQAKENALPGKPWILVLKQHRQRGAYVVCDLELFADLYRRASDKE